MARRKRLTKAQMSILRCFAQNGGRAEVWTGVRQSSYFPGAAKVFAQALHCLLANRWITRHGQNAPGSYAWTDAGREAYERGWHVPEVRQSYWLAEPTAPAEERSR